MGSGIFALRFSLGDLDEYSQKYRDPEKNDGEVIATGQQARAQGYLTRDQFLVIARWKSPRPAKRHEENDEQTVREVTRFALATPVEQLRLKALTLLSGVQARTASAILHLCHREPYPMMDVRAFWSLGVEKEPDDWLAVWPEYVKTCRDLAARGGRDMRTLDRALWAYADEKIAFAGSSA